MAWDIVIAGAGPAGMVFSSLCASQGYKVVLLEAKKREDFGRKICGDAIFKSCFDFLKNDIGLELSSKSILWNIHSGKFFSPSMNCFESFVDGFIISREGFSKELLSFAESQGVDVRFKMGCNGLKVENGKIIGARTGRGTFRSRLVCDCAGAISCLRRTLPENRYIQPSYDRKNFFSCYREIVKLKKPVEKHDSVNFYFNKEIIPEGYFWVFPKSKDIVNMGVGTSLKRANPKKAFEIFKTKLGISVSSVFSAGSGLVPARRALPSFCMDNFIIIGDAACQANPQHGGGIEEAIRGAKLAAVSIKDASDFGVGSLWSYNKNFMQELGWRMAQLDVKKCFLLSIGNKCLDFLIGTGFFKFVSSGKKPSVRQVVGLCKRPRLMRRLFLLKKDLEFAKKFYSDYPISQEGFLEWKMAEENFFKNQYSLSIT